MVDTHPSEAVAPQAQAHNHCIHQPQCDCQPKSQALPCSAQLPAPFTVRGIKVPVLIVTGVPTDVWLVPVGMCALQLLAQAA